MSGVNASPAPIPTKRGFRRAERRRFWLAIGLVSPLVMFLLLNFAVPVGAVLVMSVDDREVSVILDETTDAIGGWDGRGVPSEAVFAALVRDLRIAQEARLVHIPAKRLNAEISGFNALLSQTARRLPPPQTASFGDALVQLDRRWGDTAYWAAVKRTASPVTPAYLLAVFDLTMTADSSIVLVPESSRVYQSLWVRTLWMALFITAVCTLLGYPLAYVIANVGAAWRNVLLACVLVPFWTAGLVRTVAWIVLLQDQGVINDLGLYLGLWTERLALMHNRFGVYIAMTYILLPYMVLPLYATMRRVPPAYVRAATSLGANPAVAFLRVYLPLTLHGVGAGALMVFILAIGFYVTPMLIGGTNDQMVSSFIAFFTTESLNWGIAAALSVTLLALTVVLYFAMDRIFGISRLRMAG